MVRWIVILTVALIAFCSSAAIATYLQSKNNVEKDEAEPRPDVKKPKQKKIASSTLQDADSGTIGPSDAGQSPEDKITNSAKQLQKQYEGQKVRDELVAERERQVEVIQKTVELETEKVENLKKVVQDDLKRYEDAMGTFEKKAGVVAKEKEELNSKLLDIKKAILEVKAVEGVRIKKLASVVESMDVEGASSMLKKMVEDGDIDVVTKIVGLMKERQAAKLLAEIGGPTASTIAARLTGLRLEADEKKKSPSD